MDGQLGFLFYISLPILILGFGYYYLMDRRKNKLFSQFDKFRREVYRLESVEEFKDLERRVMVWAEKLRLETEKPWRTEIFYLMREKRNYYKEQNLL